MSQQTYQKHQSFSSIYSRLGISIDEQTRRAQAVLAAPPEASRPLPSWADAGVLAEVQEALGETEGSFRITQFVADEMSRLPDGDLPCYLFHRFRYDVFPSMRRLDAFPPYFQLEPTSVCNFRCVFCYQTDKSFSSARSGFMGRISKELFSDAVDELAGNVEFGSLASRGEPTVHRELEDLLTCLPGKFLGLKMNTNASMLTESLCHAILASGIKTVVISADAAKEPDYSRFRVKGSLERTLTNVKRFEEIRQRDYADAGVITRVSGVFYEPKSQKLADMVSAWSDYVDQVAFVDYNPWESVYESPLSEVDEACSDLWRRLFIWHDGLTNPCDTDYKSLLSPGRFPEQSIREIWQSDAMTQLRQMHQSRERSKQEPCNRCVVV